MTAANQVRYGLSASIFTRDVNTAFRAMRDFETGIVYVNAGTIGAETHLPFGGLKETGNGHREAGHAALDTFTEWKSIYVDYIGPPPARPDRQPVAVRSWTSRPKTSPPQAEPRSRGPSAPRTWPSGRWSCARPSTCRFAKGGVRAATKSLVRRETRAGPGGRRDQLRDRGRRGRRVPGPQRRRQDDHAQDAVGPAVPDGGRGARPRLHAVEARAAFLRRITMVMGNRNQLQWDLPALDSFELHPRHLPPAARRVPRRCATS